MEPVIVTFLRFFDERSLVKFFTDLEAREMLRGLLRDELFFLRCPST